MPATTVHPNFEPRADTAAADLLRRVRSRVQAGEDTAHAWSEEFAPEVVFYRAAAIFTHRLPELGVTRLEHVPRRLILVSLDQAIMDADEVKPRRRWSKR